MTITNILKDGTVVDDMSKVTVPKEIAESVIKIISRKREVKSYDKASDSEV